MRIVVMGTGPFIVPSFRSLLQSEHQILALVTQPIPQKRRGTPPPNPTRAIADEHGLPILDPLSVNEADSVKALGQLNCDLLVVCDYGQILSEETLSTSRLGGINLHGSLLPKFRGAAPVQWAILSGEDESGVSVIHMTPKLDAGPCLCTAATPIGGKETAGELEERLAVIGVDAVNRSIEMLESWDGESAIGEVQDPALATRAPRLKKQDGAIDWTQPAVEIERRVRAFQPWPGTFTFWQQAPKQPLRLIVVSAEVVDEPLPSGEIRIVEEQLYVGCGQQSLSLLEVKPAGKRSMSIAEFARGYRLESGHTFSP